MNCAAPVSQLPLRTIWPIVHYRHLTTKKCNSTTTTRTRTQVAEALRSSVVIRDITYLKRRRRARVPPLFKVLFLFLRRCHQSSLQKSLASTFRPLHLLLSPFDPGLRFHRQRHLTDNIINRDISSQVVAMEMAAIAMQLQHLCMHGLTVAAATTVSLEVHLITKDRLQFRAVLRLHHRHLPERIEHQSSSNLRCRKRL